LSRAKLQHLSYELQELDNGAKVYTRARPKTEKRAAADPLDKGEGDLLQAMFDDSAAIGEVSGDEESSSVAALDDL